MTQNELIVANKDAPLVKRELPIADLLRSAIDKGHPTESLERIAALWERVDDRARAEEFARAIAQFQGSCPPIRKTSSAKITTKGGSQYGYQYAELDEIARTIQPHLRDAGLSYTWDSEEKGGQLTCTCTLRHVNGHSVSAKFNCPTDTASAMSAQQRNAAALTYARRQSLVQVLGLTTCDPDLDGADMGNVETITEHQAANLDALIDEVAADRPKFLRFMGVDSLGQIPASEFSRAVRALESKRGAR